MFDPEIVFSAVGFAKSVAEYFGMIASLDYKTDKLIGSEMAAGLQSLKQAAISNNKGSSLLREDRNRFNEAAVLRSSDGFRIQMEYPYCPWCMCLAVACDC